MDPVEEFLIWTVLPLAYPSMRNMMNSRISNYLLAGFVVINLVVFIANASQFFEIANEQLYAGGVQKGILLPRKTRHSETNLVKKERLSPSELVKWFDEEERESVGYNDAEAYEGAPTPKHGRLVDILDVLDRSRPKYSKWIGKVKSLKPGILLVANPNEDDFLSDDGEESFFARTVVLLTRHGGHRPSQGYVVNAILPHDETEQARKMLHIYGSQDSVQSRMSSEDEERFSSSIQNPQKLWLGVGGPIHDENESWMHIHNCTSAFDAHDLARKVAFGGDIIEILLKKECFVKLLYGATMWSPGELDAQVLKGSWLVRNTSSEIVFDPSTTKNKMWESLLDTKGRKKK